MTATTATTEHLTTEYLTADDLTELVPGTTRGYWAQLRYRGDGPKFLKPSPRIVLYRRADVIAWIESSERTITSRDAA